jgi:methionine-rich copper-binding protein CopC
MTRVLRRLLAISLVLALALALPAGVAGHAVLVSSLPSDGEVLPQPPAEVRGTFSEPIEPARSHMEVLGPGGSIVARGGVPAGETRVMVAQMPDQLPAGTYTVQWTTFTPDDQHTERGEFTFRAEAASASPTPTPGASPSTPPPSPSPSPSPSATPSPSPSAAPGGAGAADPQVLLPIVAVLAVTALLGWRLVGRRPR